MPSAPRPLFPVASLITIRAVSLFPTLLYSLFLLPFLLLCELYTPMRGVVMERRRRRTHITYLSPLSDSTCLWSSLLRPSPCLRAKSLESLPHSPPPLPH